MPPKLIRITTVPLSLEKLLEGQLTFMSQFFEVTAISADKDRLEKYGEENKVATFHIEMTREITPIKDLKALFKLYHFFKKEKPDIVHTHTPKAGILGMLAGKLAGVPVRLHTVAGMPLMETSGPRRIILEQVEKLTYACATKIYPNSYGLKKIILQERFSGDRKLKVLGNGSSNGIDTEYFNPSKFSKDEKKSIRNTLGIPHEDVVFLFVGRIVTDKGINELIKAFKNLKDKIKNISLLLIGPFEQDLDPLEEASLEEIKKNNKIITTGYQADVRSYFAIADLLVFPSYREGFPNVVMQAGAMGLPSIVSDINGCNEIIQDGVNGMIIPVKDSERLEFAMEKMVIEPGKRSKLASRARAGITEEYDRTAFWNLLLQEYELQMKEAGLR